MNAPRDGTFVLVQNLSRKFDSYPNGGDVYALSPTHDQEVRIAGISESVSTGSFGGKPLPAHWQIRGTFGYAITPKSTCTKDAQGFGCDEIKLRASFYDRPATN